MKKQYIHIIIFSVLTIFFSGCFGLGGYLTGMEAMDAKTFNEYQKNIKIWRDYWRKDGSSEETKTKDWMECGGKPNGDFGADGSMERYNLLKSKLIECMQKKGYKIDRKY